MSLNHGLRPHVIQENVVYPLILISLNYLQKYHQVSKYRNMEHRLKLYLDTLQDSSMYE